MRITISGLPGSGTTTASRLVADDLGLEHVYAGAVFRALADEHGMSLADFGAHAEGHPEVDVELDERMVARARAGRCVVEGRLSGWMVTREGVDALRVWVVCDPEVRAARVADREASDPGRARSENDEREASERTRYRATYGIDLDDLSIYDLVVDSGALLADEVAAEIVAAARQRFVT